MRELLIRASSIGRIMTEPRTKGEGALSAGAKTYIRQLAAEAVLGLELFDISSKEMLKGIECEPDSIALLNRVRGLSLDKNTERRNNGFVTGECDLFDPVNSDGYDLKTAWSAATFPILPDDIGGTARALYEWQARAYTALWDADRWHIAYALVNTPERLVKYEPVTLHCVDHIPEHMRLTVWTIERDAEKEAAMTSKVKAARSYYAQVIEEFDLTHRMAEAIAA